MCDNISVEVFPWKDVTQTLIAFTALIVSIVTFRLNRRISLKKTVKDRQFDVVLELIDSISRNEISFWWQGTKEGGISGMSLYHLTTRNFKERNQVFFESKNMFFQSDSYDGFKFLQLMGNPFLPQEIYDAIDKFYYKKPKLFSYEEVKRTGNFIALITTDKKTNEASYYSSQTESHHSFEAFQSLVVNLFLTINLWLDKHDAGDIKFRMDITKY